MCSKAPSTAAKQACLGGLSPSSPGLFGASCAKLSTVVSLSSRKIPSYSEAQLFGTGRSLPFTEMGKGVILLFTFHCSNSLSVFCKLLEVLCLN